METLNSGELASVSEGLSDAVFRFGDGNRMKSLKYVEFPCILANKAIRIRTDVVDSDIPLLLSKSSMKRAGMIINMNDDTVHVFGQRLPLHTSSLGHYILPIYKTPTTALVNEVLVNSSCDSDEKIILKLHKQFAHLAPDKLKKLLVSAGRGKNFLDIVDQVSKNCEICQKFKRTRPRPVVCLPLASTFDETVAMDLKAYEGEGAYFLVCVDFATRFCAASVIKDKRAETVVRSFIMSWITTFGAPAQILSDNGLEFNNDVMRCLGDNFDIKLLCTAAYSPWSNGVCERLNAILGLSVNKIKAESECDVCTALAWAVSTRNSLHNFGGFPPNQLVFGYNPSLPNIASDGPPALELSSNSELVARNLNAMHHARREFICNESNERIRRALLHQVRAER